MFFFHGKNYLIVLPLQVAYTPFITFKLQKFWQKYLSCSLQSVSQTTSPVFQASLAYSSWYLRNNSYSRPPTKKKKQTIAENTVGMLMSDAYSKDYGYLSAAPNNYWVLTTRTTRTVVITNRLADRQDGVSARSRIWWRIDCSARLPATAPPALAEEELGLPRDRGKQKFISIISLLDTITGWGIMNGLDVKVVQRLHLYVNCTPLTVSAGE